MKCYDYTGRDDSDSNAAAVAFKFTVTATRNALRGGFVFRAKPGCGILKSRGRLLNRECRMSCTIRNLTGYLILYGSLVCHGGARPPLKLNQKYFFLDSNHERGGKRNASGSGSAHPPQLSTGALSRRGIGNFGDSFDELHDAVHRRACRGFWRICVCQKDMLGNTIELKWQKRSQLCFMRQLILRSTGSRRQSLVSKMGRRSFRVRILSWRS